MRKHGVYKFKPYDMDRIIRDFLSNDSIKESIFDEHHSIEDGPRQNKFNHFFNEYVKRGHLVLVFDKEFSTGICNKISHMFDGLEGSSKKDEIFSIVDEIINDNPQCTSISLIIDEIKAKLYSRLNINACESGGKIYSNNRVWSKTFTDEDAIEVIDNWSQDNGFIWVNIIENPYLVCDELTGLPKKSVFKEFIPTKKSQEFLESKGCKIIKDEIIVSLLLEDMDVNDREVGEEYFGQGYEDKVLEQARKEFSSEKYQAFKKEFLSKDIYHRVFDHRGDVDLYNKSLRRNSKISLNKYRDLFNSYGDFDGIEDETRFTKDVMPKPPSAKF